MEEWWSQLGRFAMLACGCHREETCQILSGAPPLKMYWDLETPLVKRQLEFRRLRKTTRDASYNSLTSLGTLSEEGSEALMPRIHSTPSSFSHLPGLVVPPVSARLAG